MKIGGKQVSNWWLIGGGGVAVVGVWFLYKKGASSSAAASSTGTGSSAIDPLTGLPVSEDNTIDPLTGMTYLAEAQQYGSVQAAEEAVSSGAGYYGSGVGSSGGLDSGYPTGYYGDTTPVGNSFSTNAQWAQAVTSGLVSLGYSATDVAAALGLFFAQQPLGSGSDGVSYASIIQAAEAEYGPPPQGTYSIISTPSGGGTTTTGGATITVPNVVGLNYEASDKAITAAGLVVSPASSNGQASGISGGGWTNPVTAQSPAAGTTASSGSTVTITGSATANPGGTNTGGSTGGSTGGNATSGQAVWNSRPKSVAAIQALPSISQATLYQEAGKGNGPPSASPSGWFMVPGVAGFGDADPSKAAQSGQTTGYASYYGVNGTRVAGPVAAQNLTQTPIKGGYVSEPASGFHFVDVPETDFVNDYNYAAKGVNPVTGVYG